jgi:hypothetical protein
MILPIVLGITIPIALFAIVVVVVILWNGIPFW